MIKNRFFSFFLVFFLLFFSAIGIIYTPILRGNRPVKILVYQGTSLVSIVEQLEASNQIFLPKFFAAYLLLLGVDRDIQIGAYVIDRSTSFHSLKNAMILGLGTLQHLTIVEGSNFHQVVHNAKNHKFLSHDMLGLTDSEIFEKISTKSTTKYEGRLFPATYFFVEGESGLAVLTRAYNNYRRRVAAVLKDCDPSVPYRHPYELTKVASLIQRESAFIPEYNKIADVIINRLNSRMYLQIDAALLYQPNSLSYRKKVDRRRQTPYNVYKYYGLPPTAIANPGRSALTAACHPEHTKFLYYVANGRGQHVFNRLYSEHLKAKKRYKLFVKSMANGG